MIINYDLDLKTQKFLVNGAELKQIGGDSNLDDKEYYELGEIDNPAVAWDVNAVMAQQNGKIIARLFGHPRQPVDFAYDLTFNRWHKLQGTWPPTIDTMIHLRGQSEAEGLKRAKSILEVACGTGMAGSYALNKNSSITQATFIDINERCISEAISNGAYHSGRTLSYFESDGFGNTNGKFDAIIASAIPATPWYNGLKRPLNPLFEGTDLVETILQHSQEHLNPKGSLIVSHSSVGDVAFDMFEKKYGARVKNLYEREAGFRVEFLGDQEWVDFLVEQGGLREENKQGFPYWHTVRVKEVSYD